MASSRWASAALALACGCNLASGLDEFDVARSTGGAAGSTAATGGAAGSPVAVPCALEPRDDFGDGVLGAEWSIESGANNVVEAGGLLQLGVPIDVTDWIAAIATVARYSLEGCGAVVEHAGALPMEGQSTFALLDAPGNRVSFMRVGGELRCQFKQATSSNNTTTLTVPYDDKLHHWLWLRPLADATEWYVSADGASWTLLATDKKVVDANTLLVRLSAGVNAQAFSPGFGVTYDNLNVLPL